MPRPLYRPRTWIVRAVLLLILGLMLSWAVGDGMMRSHLSDVAPAKAPARDLRIALPGDTSLVATYWLGPSVLQTREYRQRLLAFFTSTISPG